MREVRPHNWILETLGLLRLHPERDVPSVTDPATRPAAAGCLRTQPAGACRQFRIHPSRLVAILDMPLRSQEVLAACDCCWVEST